MDSNTGQVSLSNWVYFLHEATNSAAAINYVSCASSVGGTTTKISDLDFFSELFITKCVKTVIISNLNVIKWLD